MVTAVVTGVHINTFDYKGNYSATSNNTKSIGGLLHSVQREGPGRAWARPVPSSLYRMYQPTDQRPVYQSLYCYIMVRCSAVLMWRLKG